MKRAVFVAAVFAFLLPGTAAAQAPRLVGTVGPGFTISLTDAAGAAVTQLQPGSYEIVVTDRSDGHNFHLSGPGVNQRTEVEFVGTVTWAVTFTDGIYSYVCDPHSTQMAGSFTAGTPPPPPPPPPPAPPAKPGRLNGTVGPGFTISLRTIAGTLVRSVKAGLFTIVIRDRSKIHNFHLTGPGVNRKTGVAFTGIVSWSVRFRKGATYRFVCDPHKLAMKGSFRAT
jgi:plastocyanin